MVNVEEKQIEEKFEKIYKEERETKSRRDRMRKSGFLYVEDVCKTCVRRGTSSI